MKYCAQPIKVPFNSQVFAKTEITMRLPIMADAISKIRLVMHTDSLEEIIQEAEILNVEKLYGEFIRIRNDLSVSIEKTTLRNELSIIDLPFYCLRDLYFDPIDIRILFNGKGNEQLYGHFLIDYVATDSVPKIPYFKKTRHVAVIKSPVVSSSKVVLDAYIPGSVYELFFTVRDAQNNFITKNIKNIKLLIDDRERFNLPGEHLMYIEPLKSFGSFSSNVMMYSFSIDEEYGQTLLSTKQRFVIDFFNNTDSGVFTIWACSRNFVYNSKHIFETYEYVQGYINEIQPIYPVPLRTSSVVFLNSMTIFTTSNVLINTPTVQIFNGNSNQIITYSSPGFSDVQCVYNYSTNLKSRSSLLYSQYIPSANGLYTYIDGNNRVYTSSNQIYIDQYANIFLLSSDGSLSKYSNDMKTLFYTIPGVSSLPATYFGFEVIPLLNKTVNTSNGNISLSNVASCVLVDSSNIYITDGYNVYIYSINLQRIRTNSFGNSNSTRGIMVINSIGPVLSQSNYGVIQYDFSLHVVSHTSIQGTAHKIFVNDFDQVYVSFINSSVFTIYKLGTSIYYQLSGADSYDISFSGSIFMLVFSAINSDIITSIHTKVPKGFSNYILLDLNLIESNGTETNSYNYFNSFLNNYTSPKYDASYFSPNIVGTSIPYIKEYLWNNFMSSSSLLGSCLAASTSNVYVSTSKNLTYSNIVMSSGTSNVYIPNGLSTVLISMDSITSNINWASYIDNSNDINAVSNDSSNVYMGFKSSPVSTSNMYNSDSTVFKSAPSNTVSMVKYDINGFGKWFIYCNSGGVSGLFVNSIACDNSNVYFLFTSGVNAGQINMYDSTGSIKSMYYTNYTSAFILKFNSNTGIFLQKIVLYDNFYFGSSITGFNILYQNSTIYITVIGYSSLFFSYRTLNFPRGYPYQHFTINFIVTDQDFNEKFGIMIACSDKGGTTVDSSGNIYISGYSTGSTDIYDSGSIYTDAQPTLSLHTTGPFIIKFSNTGVYQWNYFLPSGTLIQSSSNQSYIFVIGYTSTAVTIGTVNIPAGSSFILCLTLSGTYTWVSYISNSRPTSVTCDSTSVYFSGNYSGSNSYIIDSVGIYYNTIAKTNIDFYIKFNASTGYLVYLPAISTFTAVYTLGTGIVLSWTGPSLTTVSVALVSGPPITGFTSPQTYSGNSGIISSGFTNGSSYTFSITPVGGIPFSVQPTVNIWGTLTGFTAVYTPGTGIVLSWTGTNITTVSVALVSGPAITGFTSPQTYSGTSGIISSGFTNGSSYTFSITPVGGPTFVTQATVTTIWGTITGFTAVYTPGTGIVLSWTGTNITTVSVALVSGSLITGFTSPQTYSGTSGIISSGFTNGSSYTFSITPVGGTTFLTQHTVTPVWGAITGFTAVYTAGTGIVLSWTGTNITTVSVALVSGPAITGFNSPQTYSGNSGIISSGFTNGSSYTFSITPIGGTTFSTQPTVNIWGTLTGFTAVYTPGTGIVLSWTGTNITTVSVALVSGPAITGFTSPQTYSGTSGIISSGFTNGSSYTFRISPVGGPVYGTSAVSVTSLEYPPVAIQKNDYDYHTTTFSGQPYGNGTYYYGAYNDGSGTPQYRENGFNGRNLFDKLNDGTPYTYYASHPGYYLADTGLPDRIYIGQINISSVTYTGDYIYISLPYPIILTSYSFSFVSTTTNTPYNWVLGGTNDNNFHNNLVLIDQQNAQTPTPGTTVTYTTNSIVPYSSFCISLTCAKPNPGASGYTEIDIGEWRLFGF